MAVLIALMVPSLSISQESGLNEAVLHGDEAQVSRLIAGGADINARNRLGITPLMEAAGRGNVKIMTMLLDKGADVNAKWEAEGFKGLTPLMIAVFGGHLEAARVLIAKGADVNARYDGRWSALTIAAADGRQAIAELLVKNGADRTNLEKDVAEYRNTTAGVESRKAHLAALNATLKNAYISAQAYLIDHPGSTITKLSQLEEAGFRGGADGIVFVRSDISEVSGSMVFLSRRLDESNSIAAGGLRTGEAMINFAGEMHLPKLK